MHACLDKAASTSMECMLLPDVLASTLLRVLLALFVVNRLELLSVMEH